MRVFLSLRRFTTSSWVAWDRVSPFTLTTSSPACRVGRAAGGHEWRIELRNELHTDQQRSGMDHTQINKDPECITHTPTEIQNGIHTDQQRSGMDHTHSDRDPKWNTHRSTKIRNGTHTLQQRSSMDHTQINRDLISRDQDEAYRSIQHRDGVHTHQQRLGRSLYQQTLTQINKNQGLSSHKSTEIRD